MLAKALGMLNDGHFNLMAIDPGLRNGPPGLGSWVEAMTSAEVLEETFLKYLKLWSHCFA